MRRPALRLLTIDSRRHSSTVSLHTVLLALLIVLGLSTLTHAQVLPTETQFGDTVKCYSCMSKLYGAIWENHLALLYKKPKNFTDTCDDIAGHPEGVPAVHCTSICLSMSEQTNIAGVRVKTHIRGCMSDLLINGFNTTIVQWYRWLHRDSCRMYRKKELFKLPGDFNDDSMIEVCTCYDNNCNGSNSALLPSPSSLILLLLSTLLLLRL